jgi:hypothetical protein
MGRTWALALVAAGLLGAGGCTQSGSYRLSWVFLVDGTLESSATACGRHGIDSILATGTDGSGDAQQVIALCVPGQFGGSAAPGTWTFTFQMLDAERAPVHPVSPPGETALAPVPAGSATVSVDGPTAEFPVQFIPLPECNDGIDNDGDGRVDLADPDCGVDLTGPIE